MDPGSDSRADPVLPCVQAIAKGVLHVLLSKAKQRLWQTGKIFADGHNGTAASTKETDVINIGVAPGTPDDATSRSFGCTWVLACKVTASYIHQLARALL